MTTDIGNMNFVTFAAWPEGIGPQPNMRLTEDDVKSYDQFREKIVQWCGKHCRFDHVVSETLYSDGIKVGFMDEKDHQFFGLKWNK